MPRYLIIDGYNAIAKIRELESKKDTSLEASRMHFIKMLLDFMSQKRMFDKVLVVFDSKEKALGVRKDSYGDVEVLFATSDRDADRVIVDLLRDSSDEEKISVSSDDNFIRNHARAYGCDVITINELRKIIMLKKKNYRSKITRDKDIEGDEAKDINAELKKHWRLD
ncbi:MAG: NYN domain-containing protein [Candidatus Omnitrophica bacterium]|nr:NYN domain-containing protein [Candidatus Omnitrophota bacterium]